MGMKKILYSFIISQLLIISVVSSVYAVEFESHQKIDCNNQEIKQNNNIFKQIFERLNPSLNQDCPDINTIYESFKITASDGGRMDFFGLSVAVSDAVAVVGMPGDDDAIEYPTINSGAVYVFRLKKGEWVEEAKILASDATGFDEFGYSVAIDNDVFVVGVPMEGWEMHQKGAVYVYRFNGEEWIEEAKLVGSNVASYGHFGYSVSIDNDIIVVGAAFDQGVFPKSGSAYVFRFNGDEWVEEAKIIADDGGSYDRFGCSIDVYEDRLIVGAEQDDEQGLNSGSAYVFYNDHKKWFCEQKIIPDEVNDDDRFGHSVSIWSDLFLVGAFNDDLNLDEGVGSAYIYRLHEKFWMQEAHLIASDAMNLDWFGTCVSICDETAVVTAPGDDDNGGLSGSAYMFCFGEGRWIEKGKLLSSDGAPADFFGCSLGLDHEKTIIGASSDDDHGLSSGSAYFYEIKEDEEIYGTVSCSDVSTLLR